MGKSTCKGAKVEKCKALDQGSGSDGMKSRISFRAIHCLGRVGTAYRPRSSPLGELGRGKALPCTPAGEGAAKPRPNLKMQLGWHAVPTLPRCRRHRTTNQAIPQPSLAPSRKLLHVCTGRRPFCTFALHPLFRLSLSGSRSPFELMLLPTPSPSALSQWS